MKGRVSFALTGAPSSQQLKTQTLTSKSGFDMTQTSTHVTPCSTAAMCWSCVNCDGFGSALRMMTLYYCSLHEEEEQHLKGWFWGQINKRTISFKAWALCFHRWDAIVIGLFSNGEQNVAMLEYAVSSFKQLYLVPLIFVVFKVFFTGKIFCWLRFQQQQQHFLWHK